MIKQTFSEIEELWVDVKDYEGLYQVSNLGRVKSLDRINKHSEGNIRIIKGKILKIQINNKRGGYCEISIHKEGHEKRFRLNRLVAIHFIPNPNNLPEVNHIDGKKENNRADNLEWMTSIENKHHGWENNLYTGNHIKKQIICNETGEVYESITDASLKIPCDRRYLQRHLNGERKTVKGFTYSYKTDAFKKELDEYRKGIN